MAALPLAQTDDSTQQNGADQVMAQLRAQQAASSQAQAPQGALPTEAAPTSAAPQAQPPAQPQQQQGQPQTPGQPQQPQQNQQAVAQSEPTPTKPRPFIDPRPYASLAEHAPQYRQMIDQVASETGASPQRLALTWAQEGGFKTQVADGKAGEKGPLQILPSTAAAYDPKNQLNLSDLHDNLTAAGRYINHLDSVYGQDTPSSVGAYQGGEGSIRDITAHPDRAMQDHPNTMARIQSSFPGQQVAPQHLTSAQKMDPKDLVDSAVQGGPNGFLKYVSQTAQSSGTNMSDAMRQAEATLVGFMASRGDVGGMQHARDFVLQIAHSGANQNLMAAHQALGAGDGQSAAQYLAKAHAFFPDGTMGAFGVDNKGQVWGQRMDEHTGRPQGQYFQVDQQGIQQMLNQTTDPGQFLKMAQQEQQSAAQTRLLDSHGSYYAGLDQERRDLAADKNRTALDVGAGHDNARVTAAAERAAGRQGQGPQAAMSKQADKEAENYYGPGAPGTQDTDPAELGRQSEIYHDVRMNGITAPQAHAVTDGVVKGTLGLAQRKDGSYAVMDPKDKSGRPIAVLSESVGARLAGNAPISQKQAGATPGAGVQPGGPGPVGAAAGSAMARATGTTNDLSGTVQPQQSSAIPTS